MNTTKTCAKCKEDKAVALFSKHRNRPDGLQATCKKCAHETRRQWARDNTDKTRVHKMKYVYGISEEKYNSMLVDQLGACSICKKEFGTTTPRIDHDHSCCSGGKACGDCVRGLLCNRCNLFLGFFENFKFMDSVKTYLEAHRNRV